MKAQNMKSRHDAEWLAHVDGVRSQVVSSDISLTSIAMALGISLSRLSRFANGSGGLTPDRIDAVSAYMEGLD